MIIIILNIGAVLTTTCHHNLAVDSDAVVEVTPLIRTESDLQRVCETRDKSILEMEIPKKNKTKENQMRRHTGSMRATLIARVDKLRPNILFRSAS